MKPKKPSLSTELIKEIHPTKNTGQLSSLSQLSPGSNKHIWWLGACGHEWEARVAHRSKGSGCPYCSGQKVLEGYNDLSSRYPALSNEWHTTKNGDLTPNKVSSGSAKKVWWVCEKNHEWEASVKSRTIAGSGCPVCYQNTVRKIKNFAEEFPQLATEWDTEKNNLEVTSPDITLSYRAWWVCSNNHSWETPVSNRVQGSGCHVCAKVASGATRRAPAKGNSLAERFPEIALSWDKDKNRISAEEVNWGSNLKFYWLCPKGHSWLARVSDRTNAKANCPDCVSFSSTAETELAEILQPFNIEFHRNTRAIIPPHELDIFVPAKNIAIEFNGVYWHSEANGKGKWYHHAKWEACRNKGIQLIQIWEDDWNRNPELVKRMLLHKLGLSSHKIGARKTTPVIVTKEEAKEFLRNNHIQQQVDGSYRVGLKHGKEIVAVMVLKKEPGTKGKTLNLLRYATSKPVTGGFTKLLYYIERTYPEVEEIITFSDNTVSDGNLYQRNGFVKTKDLPPDYYYVVKGKREHKFNYRKQRFQKDANLVYKENLTESELAELNKLYRIWDAGKNKWVRTIIR